MLLCEFLSFLSRCFPTRTEKQREKSERGQLLTVEDTFVIFYFPNSSLSRDRSSPFMNFIVVRISPQ